MTTPATEHLAAWIERNAGPLGAWLVQALLWLTSGMSPLAVAGSLAALWWTIERARTVVWAAAYLRDKKVTSQR